MPEGAASGPELEITFTLGGGDDEVCGHFVIDRRINRIAGGGIRVVPGLTLLELGQLARAMTLKYAFLNLPIGGAKAGLALGKAKLPQHLRRSHLQALGRKLAPFRASYLPGKDMGTDDEDLDTVLTGMGLTPPQRRPDTAYYTALTLRVSLEELLRIRSRQLAGCRIALEGFGEVGGWVARLLSERGARISAVSTREGFVYSQEGLDIEMLLRLRSTQGSACVHGYPGGHHGDASGLATLAVDAFLPCAHSASVGTASAGALVAEMIVPAANSAVTSEAKSLLDRRGIVCFPDFVANAGGVLGSAMERLGITPSTIKGVIENDYRSRVRRLIEVAGSTARTLDSAARTIAETNLERRLRSVETPRGALFSAAIKMLRREAVPPALTRGIGLWYVRRSIRHGLGLLR